MNLLPLSGGQNFFGGAGAVGTFANLNLSYTPVQNTAQPSPLRDVTSFSSGLTDAYGGGFNNPFSALGGGGLSSMGFGNVPGFGGALNPTGSMFGGLMQQMQSQQQMMMMMMMMLMMMMQQKQNGFGGQQANAAQGGMPGIGGGAPGIGGGGAAPASGGGGAAPASGAAGTAATNPLSGDDAKTAQFIDQWLAKKGSPAASQNTGAQMVQQGKENQVDPLILLAIAGHETGYGKLGVGVNGMLGVGAYDSDPNNSTRNSKFSGVEKQVGVGARTFKNLRQKGGASASSPVEQQLQAANKGGWATDKNWHAGVLRHYNEIVKAAKGA